MYKPCKQLLLIAFIPPQSRDQCSMELLHQSSIAFVVFGRSSPFSRLCGVQRPSQQMVRKKQDAEKAPYMRGVSSMDFTSAMFSCKCLWHLHVSFAVKTIALALNPWIGSLICSCSS